MYARFFAFVVSTALLAGCTSSSRQVAQTRDTHQLDHATFEAKYPDIPFPFKIKNCTVEVVEGTAGEQLVVNYVVGGSQDELTHLYSTHMERYGWEQLMKCVGSQVLVQFGKPTRLCAVVIRPLNKKQTRHSVTLFCQHR